MTEEYQEPQRDKSHFEDIDYGTQKFEDVDANPYEIVVAVARAAREINDKAHKYLGPDYEIRPKNLALKKLVKPGTRLVYKDKNTDSSNGKSTGK